MAAGDLATLDKAMTALGNAEMENSDEIQRLVSAQSAVFKSECGSAILKKTYTDIVSGNGTPRHLLRDVPASPHDTAPVTVSKVVVDGAEVAAGDYRLVDGEWVVLLGGATFTRGSVNVEITYDAGWDEAPADVENAVLELVALRWKERSRIGQGSVSLGGENVSYDRPLSIPLSVKAVVDDYRRAWV